MDLTIILVAAGAFAFYILSRLSRRPDREFWNYYNKVLNSSEYKVKGHFEE